MRETDKQETGRSRDTPDSALENQQLMQLLAALVYEAEKRSERMEALRR